MSGEVPHWWSLHLVNGKEATTTKWAIQCLTTMIPTTQAIPSLPFIILTTIRAILSLPIMIPTTQATQFLPFIIPITIRLIQFHPIMDLISQAIMIPTTRGTMTTTDFTRR
ncbi:hypothetical protein E2C01_059642 [Portunus trituberculatus]|uniref:Uncharacterized protein n=1 Tax=Portunus trituberculatus TaxID=210409 RepID=A0A5B7H8C7_PORTR|nr:hypothetical protein [Portunus trituberculatus]